MSGTFIARRNEQDITISVHMSSSKVTCFYSQIFIKIEFFSTICEKYSSSNFQKLCPVVVELFYADERIDGHTNRTKTLVAFPQICEGNCKSIQSQIALHKSIFPNILYFP